MDHDNPMIGTAEAAPDQEEDDFNVTLDEQANGDNVKESEPLSAPPESSQRGTRQPIPHFPTTSFSKGSGNAASRYFIIKSNNHSNIDQSVKYGIWATQVCA